MRVRKADTSCDDFRFFQKLSRREALRIGGLFGIGLTLPNLLQSRSQAASQQQRTFGKANQVITLYLHGGHPQQETFDPKPNGPEAVRGEFAAISTSLPGVQFSEVLPRTAPGSEQRTRAPCPNTAH